MNAAIKLGIIVRLIILGVAERGETSTESSEADLTYTLKLPGKRLKLTALLYAKKFRNFGNKQGALRAFKKLESLELGKLETVSTKTGLVSHKTGHIDQYYYYLVILLICVGKGETSLKIPEVLEACKVYIVTL